MSFDQSQIIAVNPPIRRYGDLYLSWVSTEPAGTWFQVYANGNLVAKTKSRSCVIPAPTALTRFDIGAVGYGEATTDYSASLPSAPQRRISLSWIGGTYLDPHGTRNVAGFNVYASASAAGYGTGGYGSGGYGTGLPTIPSTPTATIPAYAGNTITDGYGMGGYGAGGYGAASASYSWESGPLAGGLWGVAVAAYDRPGNVGTLQVAYQTIAAPPMAPAQSQGGSRLSYSLAGYGVGGYGGEGYGSGGYGETPYGGGLGYGQSVAILSWEAG